MVVKRGPGSWNQKHAPVAEAGIHLKIHGLGDLQTFEGLWSLNMNVDLQDLIRLKSLAVLASSWRFGGIEYHREISLVKIILWPLRFVRFATQYQWQAQKQPDRKYI